MKYLKVFYYFISLLNFLFITFLYSAIYVNFKQSLFLWIIFVVLILYIFRLSKFISIFKSIMIIRRKLKRKLRRKIKSFNFKFFVKKIKKLLLFIFNYIKKLRIFFKNAISILVDTRKLHIFFTKYHLRFLMRVVWFYVGFINYTMLKNYNKFLRASVEKFVRFCNNKRFLLDVKKYKFIYLIIVAIFLIFILIKSKDIVFYNYLKLNFIYDSSILTKPFKKDFYHEKLMQNTNKHNVHFESIKNRYFNYKDYRFLKFINYSFLMYLLETDFCSKISGFNKDRNSTQSFLKSLKIEDGNFFQIKQQEIFYRKFFRMRYFFHKCFDLYNLKAKRWPYFLDKIMPDNWYTPPAYYHFNNEQPFRHKILRAHGWKKLPYNSFWCDLYREPLSFVLRLKLYRSLSVKANLFSWKFNNLFFPFSKKNTELESMNSSMNKSFYNFVHGKLSNTFTVSRIARFHRIGREVWPNVLVGITSKWNIFKLNRRFGFYKVHMLLPPIYDKDYFRRYVGKKKFLNLILYKKFNNFKVNDKFFFKSKYYYDKEKIEISLFDYYLRKLSSRFAMLNKKKSIIGKQYTLFDEKPNFKNQFDFFITLKKMEQSRKLMSFFYVSKSYLLDSKYKKLQYFFNDSEKKLEKGNFIIKLWRKTVDIYYFYLNSRRIRYKKSFERVLEERNRINCFVYTSDRYSSVKLPLKASPWYILPFEKILDVIAFIFNTIYVIFMIIYDKIISKITPKNLWWLIRGFFTFAYIEYYVYTPPDPITLDHYWTENFFRRKNTKYRCDPGAWEGKRHIIPDSIGEQVKYRREFARLRQWRTNHDSLKKAKFWRMKRLGYNANFIEKNFNNDPAFRTFKKIAKSKIRFQAYSKIDAVYARRRLYVINKKNWNLPIFMYRPYEDSSKNKN